MFPNAINEPTRRVFESLAKVLTEDFYLAGGTALAIHLGHRLSVDLDWFSAKNFSHQTLKETLSQVGHFELRAEDEGTIHGLLDGVRVSFLRYPYPLEFPAIDFMDARLADERDIAAMKLDAVSSRGSRKDFIDLHFLLKKYPLAELWTIFEKKYAGIQFNKLHILKSLTYFEEAETEPMPVMLVPVAWEEVKKTISRAAYAALV